MAAKDLISVSRARQNISSITDNTQDGLVGALVTAISDAIEKYCRRRFVSTFYDELYSGNSEKRLLLRQYPVQSVQSVRYRFVIVMRVDNTNTALNQQARVQVTSTGLQLTRTASGQFISESPLTWSSCPTLASLTTAINGLGNGWTATVTGSMTGDYGLWPSSDLYVPSSYGDGTTTTSQGALNARGTSAPLMMHTYELQGYQWDARGWLLRAIPYTDPELLHPEDLVWPAGINNLRVQYTAGYSTIPEAVQEACARWTSMGYYETLRDLGVASQSIPGAISQTWRAGALHQPPEQIAALLAPYRRHTVGTDQS